MAYELSVTFTTTCCYLAPAAINSNAQEHNRSLLRLSVGNTQNTGFSEVLFLLTTKRETFPHILKSLLDFLSQEEKRFFEWTPCFIHGFFHLLQAKQHFPSGCLYYLQHRGILAKNTYIAALPQLSSLQYGILHENSQFLPSHRAQTPASEHRTHSFLPQQPAALHSQRQAV